MSDEVVSCVGCGSDITPGPDCPVCSTGNIDELIDVQRIVNKAESDYCDILSIPAGARLLQWSHTVRATWWYKVFSRIDPRLNGRLENKE